MLQHLIIPLDGSKLSELALEHARPLVGKGTRITLLTVVEPLETTPLYEFYPMSGPRSVRPQNLINDTLTHARSYLGRIADDLRAATGADVRWEVETGDAAAIIVDTAHVRSADLIVMSTHGRSGFSRWIFGSVTQRVLEASSCPVLVIPGKLMRKQLDGELADVRAAP